MKSIQEVFDRQIQIKKDLKTQKEIYKDALNNSDGYRKIVEDLKVLKEKKKQAETLIKKELGKQYLKIEDLKLEMESNKEMLSDIALTTIMKGETVEAQDEYGNKYCPEWSVKMKKDFQPTLGI